MNQPQYTKPFYIFFLMMPYGISSGFITITLPFLLTKIGFPVALTAGIVAIGISANIWRFVWGPVVDLSLSLHKWYWIALLATITSLMLICFIPFTVKAAALLSGMVFISQVAGTFLCLPVNGFIAKSIREVKRGEACGWYQAGGLAGTGLGGGAGLWLASHYNLTLAGIVLSVASVLFAVVIFLVKDIPHTKERTFVQELSVMGKDIFSMIKFPAALYVIILIAMPIGTGAMANLWSAVAVDWHTGVDTVVLVTGLLCGMVSAVGCVAGGFMADRFGVWNAFLGSGAICALVTFLMAILPYQPAVYIIAVLAYGFCTGLMYAAFTAIIFFVIGKRNVATKYSLLASLGNLPVVYMTTFNGWIHDKFGSKFMLATEAIVGIIFVMLFFLILKRMRYKKMIPVIVE